MPKIFLIKNRLHQQQLKLLEAQNILHSKDVDQFGSFSDNSNNDEPLSLVSRKRDTEPGKCINLNMKQT